MKSDADFTKSSGKTPHLQNQNCTCMLSRFRPDASFVCVPSQDRFVLDACKHISGAITMMSVDIMLQCLHTATTAVYRHCGQCVMSICHRINRTKRSPLHQRKLKVRCRRACLIVRHQGRGQKCGRGRKEQQTNLSVVEVRRV